MEYALLHDIPEEWRKLHTVLILIVMEYALLRDITLGANAMTRLNPYCNGICSATYSTTHYHHLMMTSLNPYCNGICSATWLSIVH